MTRIQHVSCATKTITTRSQCALARMKIICDGYTNFLNMVKTFVPACRCDTHEKNTVRIDCHCHCHFQNGLE